MTGTKTQTTKDWLKELYCIALAAVPYVESAAQDGDDLDKELAMELRSSLDRYEQSL